MKKTIAVCDECGSEGGPMTTLPVGGTAQSFDLCGACGERVVRAMLEALPNIARRRIGLSPEQVRQALGGG